MAEPYIGQMQMMGLSWAPRGWAKCDGQLLPIGQHQSLYSLIGTTYGGDGRTNFALPDLRGRACMHQGAGPGSDANYQVGNKAGHETSTLATNNMPSHTHALRGREEGADKKKPVNNLLAAPADPIYEPGNQDATMSAQAIGNTGGGKPFSNMAPFLVINWCIALRGVFPTRN